MDEKILREILITVKENNEVLRRLDRQRKLLMFFWFFKWGIFLIIAYSAYVAATPYIQSAQNTIDSINDMNAQVKQAQDQMNQKSFSDFIQKQIKKVTGQ